MRIRWLQSISGPEWNYAAGEEVDVDQATGNAFADGVRAERVDGSAKQPAQETAARDGAETGSTAPPENAAMRTTRPAPRGGRRRKPASG